MRRVTLLVAVLATASGVFAGSSVLATIVVKLSLAQLVAGAEVIAHVRVAAERTAWTADRRHIRTYYRLEPVEVIKGAATNAPFEISELGGVVGEVGMQVAGAPRYRVGEEAVVFARRVGDELSTYGWGQGRFGVVDGGVEARPGAGASAIVAAPGGSTKAGAAGTKLAANPVYGIAEPLDAFKARLRSMLAGG